ncbi:MAG: hypothetical protein R3F05_11880 [Planctomycetota bacterium]
MELILALVALLAAAGTAVLAWRSHRVSRNLALEMVQLRSRLAGIEKQLRETVRRLDAHAERPGPGQDVTHHLGALGRRLEDLEAQVAQAVEQAEALALAGPDVLPIHEDRDPDVRDLVRRGLRQQGYRRVYVLEVTPEGKALVEAERGGITAKGLAWVEPDGQVVMRSQLSHRAFP